VNARQIVAALCNERRNSDLRADDPELQCRIDAHFAELETELDVVRRRLERIDTPELVNFQQAIVLEAQHQRLRWSSGHDAGKQPEDWFWLLGYLGGKALSSHKAGDNDKALHHTISSAAMLANWHSAILGLTDMRPGIIPADIEAATHVPVQAYREVAL
jgi:hypothetical protein